MENGRRSATVRPAISHSQHVQCKCLSGSLTAMVPHPASLLDSNDQSWNKNRDKARDTYSIENSNMIEAFITDCASDTIRGSGSEAASLNITSTCLPISSQLI